MKILGLVLLSALLLGLLPADGIAQRFCGETITEIVEDDVLARRKAGPLEIQLHFDAIAEGLLVEPFAIAAGVNDKMRFTINGVGPFTVTLTPGPAQDASAIVADLNADGNFRPVADARESVQFPAGGSIRLRSQGSAQGNLQILSVANDAYTTLGLDHLVGSSIGPSATTAEQAVFEHAALEWEAIILDSGVTANPYVIRQAYYQFSPTGVTASGGGSQNASGDPTSGTVVFNRARTWWVDPSPATDVEFDANGQNGPPGWDLLAVARHEIGHSLGFYSANIRFQSFVAANNSTFDAGRLNVALDPVMPHTSTTLHPNDIMNPSFGTSVRYPISIYPAASVVARIAEYEIPQVCVDPNAVQVADGSVTFPWPLVSPANANGPTGYQALLIPGDHDVGLGVTLDRPRVWRGARGGSAVVGVR